MLPGNPPILRQANRVSNADQIRTSSEYQWLMSIDLAAEDGRLGKRKITTLSSSHIHLLVLSPSTAKSVIDICDQSTHGGKSRMTFLRREIGILLLL